MRVTDLEQINRYLSGTLPDDDALALETRMLTDARFRAEVELSQQLREGLGDLRRAGELERLTAPEAAFWQKPAFALAASVLACVASIVAFASYEQIKTLRAELAGATVGLSTVASTAAGIDVLRLVRTRSNRRQPDLTWNADPTVGQLDLRIDVGLEPAPSYAFQLKRVDETAGVVLLSLPAVAPTDGEVAVTVNAALLASGRYQITLRSPEGLDFDYTLVVSAGE
jgi:anti-sigma factor RsiW